jgi:predicted DNA-binding transcriptional regulator AlpA
MDDDEMLTIKAACEYLGGNRPIDPSTYYRGVKNGIYPAPVKVGPNTSRVSKNSLRSVRDQLIAAASVAS